MVGFWFVRQSPVKFGSFKAIRHGGRIALEFLGIFVLLFSWNYYKIGLHWRINGAKAKEQKDTWKIHFHFNTFATDCLEVSQQNEFNFTFDATNWDQISQ